MPEHLIFYADKNALSPILRNLVSNSIKYTSADDRILIAANKSEENIEIKIKDTGLGISKAQQAKLFP